MITAMKQNTKTKPQRGGIYITLSGLGCRSVLNFYNPCTLSGLKI